MILIVDDNKKYINRLVDLLNDAGNKHPIREANDFDMAIKMIEKEIPKLVLLDMNMPGKSGIEVFRYIKDEGWNCKVIMVTNHSNEGYKKLCLDAGVDIILDKTKEFNLIPDLIDNFIN